MSNALPHDASNNLTEDATAFERVRWDDAFVRTLPADPVAENRRRQVHEACYSPVRPTPVRAPELLAWAREVAALVGLPEDPDKDSAELAQVLSGNRLLPGMRPYAACYGGHQFGAWAGQLGDGRAITLGEALGEHGQRWELQLKGAGPTPYSRMGDGRAVLRSSIREFLCSEAMHHLGIPTTRALSLVGTGEDVVRDMLYDGNPRPEPGAVVCRVAPTFLRFGSFEIFTARNDEDTLQRLGKYVLETFYPELGPPSPQAYAAFFGDVCRRTAHTVAHWMRVGFVHGVMNTDNMSILGLTIDYGPYGWLDAYDPDWTPNTTDAGTRRYRFAAQPEIAAWNLVRFASALQPLVRRGDLLEDGLREYASSLERNSLQMFADKLGLATIETTEDHEDRRTGAGLVNEALSILGSVPTDMTLFYRGLCDVPLHEDATDEQLLAPLRIAYYEPDAVPEQLVTRTVSWLRTLGTYVRGLGLDPRQRRDAMRRANPKYVPRNYLAQLAIDQAEAGDPSLVTELLDVMRRPYDDQPGKERFAQKRPEWAKNRPGCSMLSCSS